MLNPPLSIDNRICHTTDTKKNLMPTLLLQLFDREQGLLKRKAVLKEALSSLPFPSFFAGKFLYYFHDFGGIIVGVGF